MDNDDTPIGRILSRREILALLGVGGLGAIAARQLPADVLPAYAGDPVAHGRVPLSVQLPACVVRPEQTEGPYFVDEKLERSDIRSDPGTGRQSPGVPLDLTIRVSRMASGGCTPLAAALVDLWQCDADGVYSDVKDTNGLFDTRGQKFLRGHQFTDTAGTARFRTIYPGWYQGRTVHVHFKIRVPAGGARYHDFTSQLYFDDALNDRVLAQAPYANRGPRSTRNAQDGIFRRGGASLLLEPTRTAEGYAATFNVGMQL